MTIDIALIENSFENISTLGNKEKNLKLYEEIESVLAQIESGAIRVAEKSGDKWVVNQWVKQAILLYFKFSKNEVMSTNNATWYDKVPLQFTQHSEEDFKSARVRIVPPAHIRRGAYIGKDTVVMPSYINIGAFVDDNCMIDTWATVGSCAQIGKSVHISGGAGIGGVLEPLQANPTIIEDDCFIGARSEIVEGVTVKRGAVISMGVFIGQSTKIYDRENDTITYGEVPENAVVVPGSLPSKDGKYNLNCAVIVKRVTPETRKKVGLNAILRETDGS